MEPIDSPDGLFHDETYPGSEDGTIITALWLNNAQAALIALSGLAGDVVALAAPYTLLASDGVALADTVAGGFTVSLPVYEDVAAVKRFTVKNISALGDDDLTIEAADGKTIDGQSAITIAAGEKITIIKDGNNWQSI